TAVFDKKHPYGRSVSGGQKEVASLGKRDIIQFYLRYYRPNNAIMVVSGKFDAAFEKSVETVFGEWTKRELPGDQIPEPVAKTGLHVRVIDKPGLTQAQIRMVGLGIKRRDDDFLRLRIANTILGGAFASRLNDRVRKELGLTYSISSNFDSRIARGPFTISTFTKIESIEKAVDETLKIYRDFIANGITREELDRAKGYLAGIFPQAIETSDKLAFNLALLRLYGISDRYLTHYIRDLRGVSVSEVNAAIRRQMKPDDLSIVIHAPKASAETLKGLKPASFEVLPVSALK
ncbi:MAG: pitrilysin family protein, partial [Bdellovibrionales bacterium]|nr:pitrilysin family protein [Bdellovibrionales bacterium]